MPVVALGPRNSTRYFLVCADKMVCNHSQTTREPPAIRYGIAELGWTPTSCGMVGQAVVILEIITLEIKVVLI